MIFRVQHNKENPYFMLNRAGADDDRLSYKALGILTYLLSKPDNWTVHEADLAARHADGTASVRAGLKELKECGYMVSAPVRDEGGKIVSWETHIYETPKETENHNVENPHSGLSTFSKIDPIVISDSLESIDLGNYSLSLPAAPADEPKPTPAPAHPIISDDPPQGPKHRTVHDALGLDPRQLSEGLYAPGTGSTGYQVLREVFDYVPGRTVIQEINKTVGTGPAALQRWRETLTAYALSGKPSNWTKVQLEWFRDGIPDAWNPNATSTTKTKGSQNGNNYPNRQPAQTGRADQPTGRNNGLSRQATPEEAARITALLAAARNPQPQTKNA